MNPFKDFEQYRNGPGNAVFSNIPIEKLDQFERDIGAPLKKLVSHQKKRLRYYWRGPRTSKKNPYLGGGQAYCLKKNAVTFSVYIQRDWSK